MQVQDENKSKNIMYGGKLYNDTVPHERKGRHIGLR